MIIQHKYGIYGGTDGDDVLATLSAPAVIVSPRQRRRELLDRMLILNAHHLRHVLAEYETHSIHIDHRSLAQAAPPTALVQPRNR